MAYRKVGSLEQIWYTIKHSVGAWIEWHDAKAWANRHHPAWVDIATRSRSEVARKYYKNMILEGYREWKEYV